MLNFTPDEIVEQRKLGDYADIARVCDDWEAMYAVVKEIAQRQCEKPVIVDLYPIIGYTRKDCGECLVCRVRKLVEEK